MKRILGRKQSTDNARWLEAVANIEELVSKDELDNAVATACESIKQVTEGKKLAYAWNGEKDSLVIADICKNSGNTEDGVDSFFEFNWYLNNKVRQFTVQKFLLTRPF